MAYRNIYFDLDNTLWDFETNAEQTLFDLISEQVPEILYRFKEFLEWYHRINDALWLKYRNGEVAKDVLRTKRFADTFDQMGIKVNGLAAKFGDDYIKNSPYKTQLFPYAIETLEYLKQKGYRLFLLTNGFAEVQVIKIRESKLEPFFDKMITSEEAGYQKPNVKIFEYALKTVNSRKSESIMIGDDLDSDIRGARNFGMDTVFFNPEGLTHEVQTTYEIKSLKEIQEIL